MNRKKRGEKYRKSFLEKVEGSQAKKYKEFFQLLNEHKEQAFFNKIKSYHGKNVPIRYKSEFNFTEQWEAKESSDMFNTSNLLQTLGPCYIAYSLLTMVLYVLGIWTISIERYFSTREVSLEGPIYQLLVVLNVVDIILRLYLKYVQNCRCLEWSQFLACFYSNLLLVAYFISMLVFDMSHLVWNFIELVVMYFLYSKAAEIYGYIKVMEFGLQYENYVKIIDLLLNIFIQAHIFALLFFTASKIDSTHNWVKAIAIENDTFIVKYVNAIYFASTTMLTIGYGDIVPRNVAEKLVTVFIQIVGVIAFGYLLNEMGNTFSKMREQSEIMERDLQTVSKISKFYNLHPKIQNKARNFIFNNQREHEELKVEDENRLLNKFNENLRQEINLETSINIVKSSIFYLCHWSKTFQLEIAQRLEKRIFSPNQKLVSSSGKDRVYIIKKGRIDISMNRYGNDQDHRRVLKVVDMSKKEKIEVTDNIYGYTAVFSNRPVKLEAKAKDFTSTFSVDKEDILFCINQNEKDFEYYHEIKCRIDQSSFCEEWQAPEIKNIREHYCPSHISTIKKYKANLRREKNCRHGLIREKRIKFDLLSNYCNSNVNRQVPEELEGWEREQSLQTQTIVFLPREKTAQNGFESVKSLVDEVVEDSFEQSCNLASLRAKLLVRSLQESDNKRTISSTFESLKEYSNFFNRSNLSNVLYCLDKENSMERKFQQLERGSEKQNL